MKSAYVIKVGGALLESPDAVENFVEQLIATENISSVLVHGGGTQVATLLNQLGFGTLKKDGLRVTPPEQIPYVVASLAGTVNKTLVAAANCIGGNAVGISALDGNLVAAETIDPELGAVGKPVSADCTLLTQLMSNDWLPVVCSIGMNSDGQLLNINADHVAAILAEELTCPLILLSDVPAVLDKSNQRIPKITPATLAMLKDEAVITDGMLVKVEAAMATAQDTGESVIIAGWRDNLTTILSGEAGTLISCH